MRKNKKILIASFAVVSFVLVAVFYLTQIKEKTFIPQVTCNYASDEQALTAATKAVDSTICQCLSDAEKKKQCIDYITYGAIDLAHKGSMNFEEKEQGEKSVEAFEKILKTDPKNREALLGMGYAYEIMEKYDKALTYYEKAQKLDENDALVYVRIGHLYDLKEGFEKAQSYYEKAAKLNEYSLDAQYNLARGYYRNDQKEKAVEIFKDIFETGDINQRTRAEIGYVLATESMETKEYDQAKDYSDIAIGSDPTLPIVWVGAGIVRIPDIEKASSNEEANDILNEILIYFDEAINLQSDSTMAHYWKGRILSASGNEKQAQESFATALKSADTDITLMQDERGALKTEIKRYITKKTSWLFKGLIHEAHAKSHWNGDSVKIAEMTDERYKKRQSAMKQSIARSQGYSAEYQKKTQIEKELQKIEALIIATQIQLGEISYDDSHNLLSRFSYENRHLIKSKISQDKSKIISQGKQQTLTKEKREELQKQLKQLNERKKQKREELKKIGQEIKKKILEWRIEKGVKLEGIVYGTYQDFLKRVQQVRKRTRHVWTIHGNIAICNNGWILVWRPKCNPICDECTACTKSCGSGTCTRTCKDAQCNTYVKSEACNTQACVTECKKLPETNNKPQEVCEFGSLASANPHLTENGLWKWTCKNTESSAVPLTKDCQAQTCLAGSPIHVDKTVYFDQDGKPQPAEVRVQCSGRDICCDITNKGTGENMTVCSGENKKIEVAPGVTEFGAVCWFNDEKEGSDVRVQQNPFTIKTACVDRSCNAQGKCQTTPKIGNSADICKSTCTSDANCSGKKILETRP